MKIKQITTFLHVMYLCESLHFGCIKSIKKNNIYESSCI